MHKPLMTFAALALIGTTTPVHAQSATETLTPTPVIEQAGNRYILMVLDQPDRDLTKGSSKVNMLIDTKTGKTWVLQRELRSDSRGASVGESQVEAKDASRAEPINLPQIGAVVRCKASLLRSPRRTSGPVKAVVSQEYGQAVVIQSIWGDEGTVTAKEYSCFFEECDPRDIARQYWESCFRE